MFSTLWVQEDWWWNWHHWLPKSHCSFSLAGKAQILFGCDNPLPGMELSPNSSQLVKTIALSLIKGHLTNSWPMSHGRVCWTLLGAASLLLRDTQGREASSPLDIAASAWEAWNGYSHLVMSGQITEDDRAGRIRKVHAWTSLRRWWARCGDRTIWSHLAKVKRDKQQVSGDTLLCSYIPNLQELKYLLQEKFRKEFWMIAYNICLRTIKSTSKCIPHLEN